MMTTSSRHFATAAAVREPVLAGPESPGVGGGKKSFVLQSARPIMSCHYDVAIAFVTGAGRSRKQACAEGLFGLLGVR